MKPHGRLRSLLPRLACLPAILVTAVSGHAQSLSGQALLSALRRGGYVIVMRHASSPREAPDAQTANPDNVNRERQLDAEGRATATAMGKAFRALRIPIGEIDSSPTYRALETVRLLSVQNAQFGRAQAVPQLGDNGRSMQISTEAQAAWLEAKVKDFPTGTNTLVVTHAPNMTRAFPQWTADLADGEALIFGPDGKGGATLVARVKIQEWPRLAQ
jgi:phosphohistidine phosphatase SixA